MRYIVCIPHGGLCDTIFQIYRCVRYAQKTQRMCIICSKEVYTFREHINSYLIPKYNFIRFANKSDLVNLKYTTVKPECLQGRIHSYKSSQDGSKGMIVENTGESLTFNFEISSNHKYDVIVHENFGGGFAFPYSLNFFRFSDIISMEMKRRLALLPKNYVSIHIRHNDYKSDIQGFIETHRDRLSTSKFFLATDNFHVAVIFKALFKKNVIIFSDIPRVEAPFNNRGVPVTGGIHYSVCLSEKQKAAQNFMAICDFLTVALSSSILYSFKLSGFTRNALEMNKYRTELLRILNIDL